MIVKVFPGGWHCTALPGRQYAVTFDDGRFVTHTGQHALTPDGLPLFPRGTAVDGVVKFCGQGWRTDRAAEWIEGQGWKVYADVLRGENPVLYDRTGTHRFVTDANVGQIGTQGYRYQAPDGRLVTGDQTLRPQNGHDLHTHTVLPCGLVIGQRGVSDDELEFFNPVTKQHHRIEAQPEGESQVRPFRKCRHIHVEFPTDSAGEYGIGFYSLTDDGQDEKEAVLLWISEAELRAMPVASVVALAPNVPSFQFAGLWVADATAPGNMAIGSASYTVPHHACVIAEEKHLASIPEARRACLLVYLHNGSDDEVKATIAHAIEVAAKDHVVPVVYDDRAQGRFDLISDAFGETPFIYSPQWYPLIGEDPQAFVNRVLADVPSFGGQSILPTIRAYCSLNNVDPAHPFDAVPESAVVAALNALITSDALKVPGFLGPLFFAWDRGDGAGLDDHGHPYRPLVHAAVTLWLKTPTTVTDARAWAEKFFVPVEIPMSIPDHSRVANDLFATDAYDLTSKEGCGVYTDELQLTLNEIDPRYRHLKKRPGQNQYPDQNGHAVDAILYVQDAPARSTTVDVVRGSAEPGAGPNWQENVEDNYTAADVLDFGGWPKSSIVRPSLPEMIGMSGFDYCTHLDEAWLDLHVEFKMPFILLVTQSVFRTKRELSQGLDQFRRALPLIAAKGLSVLVTMNCDTKEYGMSQQDVRDNTSRHNDILVQALPLFDESKGQYLIGKLANENQNWNEQRFMMDGRFMLELDHLVDPRIRLAWGCRFGPKVARAMTGGSWTASHEDRGRTPEENAILMAEAQEQFGIVVVRTEPKGAAEPGHPRIPGQRYDDPEFARQLGETTKRYKIGGLFFHSEAGLYADPAKFGPRHRECAKAMMEGLVGAVVVPPPPPPPPVDDLTTLGDEARSSAIKIAYQTLLGRDPDPFGVNFYTEKLKSGWTVQQMEDDIRASPEYRAKHGG